MNRTFLMGMIITASAFAFIYVLRKQIGPTQSSDGIAPTGPSPCANTGTNKICILKTG